MTPKHFTEQEVRDYVKRDGGKLIAIQDCMELAFSYCGSAVMCPNVYASYTKPFGCVCLGRLWVEFTEGVFTHIPLTDVEMMNKIQEYIADV